MHREFVIIRDYAYFEYIHSSLPTFRRLTIKEVESRLRVYDKQQQFI